MRHNPKLFFRDMIYQIVIHEFKSITSTYYGGMK